MAQPPLVIHCKMTSCFFYNNYPEGAETPSSNGLAICKYPENDLIEEYKACPFYRLDWRKNLQNMSKKKGPDSK